MKNCSPRKSVIPRPWNGSALASFPPRWWSVASATALGFGLLCVAAAGGERNAGVTLSESWLEHVGELQSSGFQIQFERHIPAVDTARMQITLAGATLLRITNDWFSAIVHADDFVICESFSPKAAASNSWPFQAPFAYLVGFDTQFYWTLNSNSNLDICPRDAPALDVPANPYGILLNGPPPHHTAESFHWVVTDVLYLGMPRLQLATLRWNGPHFEGRDTSDMEITGTVIPAGDQASHSETITYEMRAGAKSGRAVVAFGGRPGRPSYFPSRIERGTAFGGAGQVVAAYDVSDITVLTPRQVSLAITPPGFREHGYNGRGILYSNRQAFDINTHAAVIGYTPVRGHPYKRWTVVAALVLLVLPAAWWLMRQTRSSSARAIVRPPAAR
ncbi:MAG: hypothetical protein ACLQVX_20100 [Limisphaerales bacterium]